MKVLPPPLAALGQWRQFITYIVVPSRTRPGKTDKFPTDWRTGSVADAHDPAIWCTFEQAAATGRPVGFVITEACPFFFVDIDSALGADGKWSDLATRICEVFAGAGVEVSQSMTGLHILGTLAQPAPAHRTKPSKTIKARYDGASGLEFYTSARFVALTGISAAGDASLPIEPHRIDWLVDNFFKPEGGPDERERDDEMSIEPRPEWHGPADDEDLIRRALMSKSATAAFGSGASFADLWTADEDALAKAYPHPTDVYDRSAADMALLQHLAFWTGAHGTRMAALMWRSALVREKWGSHATYLSLSTRVACARQKEVYGSGASTADPKAPMAAVFIDLADPLGVLLEWKVTQAKVKEMEETRLIWLDIIALGHLSVWAAPGNGGKTTIAKLAAGQLGHSFRVFYFQEDASAGDLPDLLRDAEEHGYELLNSSLAGTSPEKQITVLKAFAESDVSLSGAVFFFDTLKKYVDLMSKGGSREFFQLMRALTIRGATVILLGHTNKHVGIDGKLIFEGVGDVRNDVDELFYVRSTDGDLTGTVTMTMTPDKWRCNVKARTFTLDKATREVRVLDSVIDVGERQRAERKREEDAPVIAAVQQALRARDQVLFKDLIAAACTLSKRGERTVKRVINDYCGQLWDESRAAANNGRLFSLRFDRPEVRPLSDVQTAHPARSEQSDQTLAGTGFGHFGQF